MEGQQVIEKILSDARAEAEKIKKEAEAGQAQEQHRLDEQLREYRKHSGALAQKAGAEAKSQVLSAVRMELAKEFLAEKAKILDEVFARAEQQAKSLPDEQYLSLMTKLMLDSVQTGDEEVIVDVDEKRIDQQFIDKVNQQLASKGKGPSTFSTALKTGPLGTGNLKLSSERQPIAAGFILKKGKIKNNCSLKVLLSRAWGELEIELARQLFGDDKK